MIMNYVDTWPFVRLISGCLTWKLNGHLVLNSYFKINIFLKTIPSNTWSAQCEFTHIAFIHRKRPLMVYWSPWFDTHFRQKWVRTPWACWVLDMYPTILTKQHMISCKFSVKITGMMYNAFIDFLQKATPIEHRLQDLMVDTSTGHQFSPPPLMLIQSVRHLLPIRTRQSSVLEANYFFKVPLTQWVNGFLF